MKKVLHIKGRVEGFYSTTQINETLDFKFNSILVEDLKIYESKKIENFNINQLKVGKFHYPNYILKNVRIFTETGEYFETDIHEGIIRDIEIIDDYILNDSGKKVYKFKGEIYFKITQSEEIIEQKKINENNVNNTDEPSKKTDKSNVNQDESISNDYKREESPNPEKKYSWLNPFLISGFIFLVFYFLFGFSFFTFLLPLGFLLSRFYNKRLYKYSQIRYPIVTIIGVILLILFLYNLFQSHSFNKSYSYLFIIALGLILWSQSLKLLRIIGSLFFWGLILFFAFNYFKNFKNQYIPKDEKSAKYNDEDWDYLPREEQDTIQGENNENLSIDFYKHLIKWKDNYKKNYSANLKVRKDYFKASSIARNNIEPNLYTNSIEKFYSKIYSDLIIQNNNYLNKVVEEYNSIGKSKELMKNEFADMIVTSIQTIPYCLVHENSHEEADRQGGFIREYHRKGGPCLENIKFGVQSPSEFVGNLKGDCDTRSLFLYHVMSKLGFKVVVLVSKQYGHAILGINGNYRGDYILHNGLKFYVWETTNTGFYPGHLSPNVSNMKYWKVAISNN